MERDAAPIGFHIDERRSRPGAPVFSKEMDSNWDLCWTVDGRSFCSSATEGRFDPNFGLVNKQFRDALSRAASGQFLRIQYSNVVPGFANGYWIFSNLDELETIVKAHVYLYTLMSSVVETGIKTVLEIK
jgi:hypothetical protein